MTIEYNNKYDEEIKDLLIELQEYIKDIDKEGYNILTKDYREKYLKLIGCKNILLEVFDYNSDAIKFYNKNGYHMRTIDMIKRNE